MIVCLVTIASFCSCCCESPWNLTFFVSNRVSLDIFVCCHSDLHKPPASTGQMDRPVSFWNSSVISLQGCFASGSSSRSYSKTSRYLTYDDRRKLIGIDTILNSNCLPMSMWNRFHAMHGMPKEGEIWITLHPKISCGNLKRNVCMSRFGQGVIWFTCSSSK